MKSAVEVVVFPFTVTEIFPVVAPRGTVAEMDEAEADKIVAAVPLNFTMSSPAVALKFFPVIVTVVPTIPLLGEKLPMLDGGAGSSSLQEPINSIVTIDMSAVRACKLMVLRLRITNCKLWIEAKSVFLLVADPYNN